MKVTKEEAIEKGYKTFNEGNHHLVDMSDLQKGEIETITVKGPSGRDITISLIGQKEGVIADIKSHSEHEHKMLGFAHRNDQKIEGVELYSLDIK